MFQLLGAKVKKSGEEIQFTLKGYNGRVTLEWLTHCLGDAAASPALYVDPRMGLTYAAMTLGLFWHYLPEVWLSKVFAVSLRVLLDEPAQARNQLSLFFGMMERHPRFLWL